MKIIKFGASWCNPCRLLDNTLKTVDLPIEYVDVDDNEELASKYNITNIPVLVFVDDAGKEVARLVGAVAKQTILDTWEQLILA